MKCNSPKINKITNLAVTTILRNGYAVYSLFVPGMRVPSIKFIYFMETVMSAYFMSGLIGSNLQETLSGDTNHTHNSRV